MRKKFVFSNSHMLVYAKKLSNLAKNKNCPFFYIQLVWHGYFTIKSLNFKHIIKCFLKKQIKKLAKNRKQWYYNHINAVTKESRLVKRIKRVSAKAVSGYMRSNLKFPFEQQH